MLYLYNDDKIYNITFFYYSIDNYFFDLEKILFN